MGKLRHREVQGLAHLERNQTGLQEPFFFFFYNNQVYFILAEDLSFVYEETGTQDRKHELKEQKEGSKGLWDWALKWRLSEHPLLLLLLLSHFSRVQLRVTP